MEVHREEDESGGESESWLSGPSQTTQSQTTGQSKSKSDLAEDYPGIFFLNNFLTSQLRFKLTQLSW